MFQSTNQNINNRNHWKSEVSAESTNVDRIFDIFIEWYVFFPSCPTPAAYAAPALSSHPFWLGGP